VGRLKILLIMAHVDHMELAVRSRNRDQDFVKLFAKAPVESYIAGAFSFVPSSFK
jgi:hypothetical protein